MNISLMKKLNIFGTGVLSTLLLLLMTETLFAQLVSDLLIGNINDNLVLLIIILGLFIFTIFISLIVGFYITKDIHRKAVFSASRLSFFGVLLFLFFLTNIFLFIFYPNVYSKVHGFEILPIFPQVLVYFGIYILDNIFYLFILIIVVYYMFFVILLEKFFIERYYNE